MCKKKRQTFSFLPVFLVPYCRYPIMFMIKACSVVKSACEEEINKKSNHQQVLDGLAKEKAFENLEFSHVKSFIKRLDVARERYVYFTGEIINNTFEFLNKCILFSWKDYNGPLGIKGYILEKSGYFLFGNASQHR